VEGIILSVDLRYYMIIIVIHITTKLISSKLVEWETLRGGRALFCLWIFVWYMIISVIHITTKLISTKLVEWEPLRGGRALFCRWICVCYMIISFIHITTKLISSKLVACYSPMNRRVEFPISLTPLAQQFPLHTHSTRQTNDRRNHVPR
jgi:hypothetical protein